MIETKIDKPTQPLCALTRYNISPTVWWAFMLTFNLLLVGVCNGQDPYVPQNDDEVLERLPKSLSLNRDRMVTIRQRLAQAPDDYNLAASAALGYIKMGDQESDPRFYGYARSAVEPWWEDESPTAAVVKVRAKLKEKDHQYREAIADLESLIKREPDDAQAYIELANLYRVVGDFEKAFAASEKLSEFSDESLKLIAEIPLLGATGKAEQAMKLLEEQLESSTSTLKQHQPWIVATQAGLAATLGHVETADSLYRKALQLNSESLHLKRTYAEFLLDYGKADAVERLLSGHENDNGSLLLLAVAAKRQKKTDIVKQLGAKLVTRFKEIRLRGSQPHGRFESRYELALNNDPDKALKAALKNWQLQKEIRDARAVLESAVASQNAFAAREVIEFLEQTGCEDVVVKDLIGKLKP